MEVCVSNASSKAKLLKYNYLFVQRKSNLFYKERDYTSINILYSIKFVAWKYRIIFKTRIYIILAISFFPKINLGIQFCYIQCASIQNINYLKSLKIKQTYRG